MPSTAGYAFHKALKVLAMQSKSMRMKKKIYGVHFPSLCDEFDHLPLPLPHCHFQSASFSAGARAVTAVAHHISIDTVSVFIQPVKKRQSEIIPQNYRKEMYNVIEDTINGTARTSMLYSSL